MPLLVHEKSDVKIIDACIRLLVNLTIPVECLLPMEIMARTDAGRHTIYELNNLLFSAKDAFVEPRSTRSILDFIRKIIDQVYKSTGLVWSKVHFAFVALLQINLCKF